VACDPPETQPPPYALAAAAGRLCAVVVMLSPALCYRSFLPVCRSSCIILPSSFGSPAPDPLASRLPNHAVGAQGGHPLIGAFFSSLPTATAHLSTFPLLCHPRRAQSEHGNVPTSPCAAVLSSTSPCPCSAAAAPPHAPTHSPLAERESAMDPEGSGHAKHRYPPRHPFALPSRIPLTSASSGALKM